MRPSPTVTPLDVVAAVVAAVVEAVVVAAVVRAVVAAVEAADVPAEVVALVEAPAVEVPETSVVLSSSLSSPFRALPAVESGRSRKSVLTYCFSMVPTHRYVKFWLLILTPWFIASVSVKSLYQTTWTLE